MKIISWNVNGIRSILSKNFDEFVNEYKPDILCLQETRIQEAKALALELNFKYKYFFSADKAGYAGTAILSNIEPKSIEKVSMQQPNEGRILSADFGDYVLTTIYAPNSQDKLKRIDFKHAWNKNLQERLAKNKANIICGDFNVAHHPIDLARPKQNEENAGYSKVERDDFSDILNNLDLLDIWRYRNPDKVQYSWWSFRFNARANNTGWRIDYFLVSKNIADKITKTEILSNVTGSDHAPLLLEVI